MEMGKLMALALSCGFLAAGWFLYSFTIPFLGGATPVELALDTQPLLCWLRKGELCSSGELEGFGDCENKFLCSEVPPQVRLARRKNGSPQGCLGSIRAQQWFQLAQGITSTCCLASSAHRAQDGAPGVQTQTEVGIKTL